MAIFMSEVAFNITTYNLHSLFDGTAMIKNVGGNSLTIPSVNETFVGITLSIPEQTYSFSSAVLASFASGAQIGLLGDGVAVNSLGYVTAGAVTGIATSVAGKATLALFGTHIAAADLRAAEFSASNFDDRALLMAALAGNDAMALSQGDDHFDAGGGNDFVVNQGGRDTLAGGTGADMVIGGTSVDKVDGGDGNDIIVGMAGNDRMAGGAGVDIIAGERGIDRLAGGAGADYFVFSKGDGSDFITDFDTNGDKVLITGSVSFSDLSIRQDGSNLQIKFLDVTIGLYNTTKAEVTVTDFIFGGRAILGEHIAGFFEDWTIFG